MKLTFQKTALLNGINIVLKAVPSKTTMPILECILIDASTDEIKLTANDMEKLKVISLKKVKLHWMQSFFLKSQENYPIQIPL